MEESIRQYNGYKIGSRFRLRVSVALTKAEKEERRVNIAARIAGEVDMDEDERDSAKENKAPPKDNIAPYRDRVSRGFR
jgi:hypothetical protein